MEEPKPWLSQGDVFAAVPIVVSEMDGPNVRFDSKPAGSTLLLTHSCQLDKRDNDGGAKVKRLQFAPVRPLADLAIDNGIKGQLRNGWLNPPEAVYIRDPGDGEEAAALLSEAFTVPAGYFDLIVQDWSLHADSDSEDPHHAVARLHGERTATMGPDELRLLQSKMAAFWTGERFADSPDH